MDGKTIRRSGAGNPDANVKLFSAMLHDQAVVIAQIRVPHGTNETTQVGPLLDRLDLAGAVITGDAWHAAHTQTGTARYLQDRGADYVLTPKANKPTLLGAVAAKLFTATDPGHHL